MDTIWIIAGLGNPEARYNGTRHNAGFDALDTLARAWGAAVDRARFQGLAGQAQAQGHRVLLLKPTTYMNLSGQSIAQAAAFYKVPPQRVLVLCDDIAQQPGQLRIRPSGSAGGHNGLKSIIASLGSDQFPRIRIGVGAKPHPDYDLAAWVLGKPDEAGRKAIEQRLADIAPAALLIMDGKLQQAQNLYNKSR